jgi:predicted kinase
MDNAIFVIEGYLASGKSTFARRLSNEIKVPYLIKDTFKIALCDSVQINTREEGSRFSAITFDAMMYVTERLMETGYPIIIEGNFVPPGLKKVNEAGVIQSLTRKYSYRPLIYKFLGDTQVLYKRYIERENSPERGDANRDFAEIPYENFERYCHNLDMFSIGGKVIKVDTTDFEKVDFKNLIELARRFIQSEA